MVWIAPFDLSRKRERGFSFFAMLYPFDPLSDSTWGILERRFTRKVTESATFLDF